jgi:hypothetical protein
MPTSEPPDAEHEDRTIMNEPDDTAADRLTENERRVLGDRVFCVDRIGFSAVPVAEAPSALALGRVNQRNLAVLRSLAMLEEHDDKVTDDGERAELRRLEGKVDLLLELVSELVRERRPGGEPRVARFSAEGVCWTAPEAEFPGALLLTEWFLIASWPVSLKLHVRIDSSDKRDDGYRICGRLEGTNDTVKDWLEKLVFRRHRRAIAQRRVTRSDTPG